MSLALGKDVKRRTLAVIKGRDELRQALEQARDALQWYADKVNECNRHGSDGDAARDALAKDTGDRARAALQTTTTKENPRDG